MRSIALALQLVFWISASGSLSYGSETDLGRGRFGDILYVHHAPDPVNVRNGNFFLPVQDLYLPCFGIPIEVYRSYNSVSSTLGAFGKGWTYNYDLQIVVDEKAGLRVLEADGFVNEFIPIERDSEDGSSDVDKIIEAKRAEDRKYLGKTEGKGEGFYDDFRAKLLKDSAFLKRQRDKYVSAGSVVSKSGKYVSRKRGVTFLEKKGTGWIRTAESGRVEEYDGNGLLTAISDRNDNRLKLSYDSKNRLGKVTDGCEQFVRFTYNPQGRVTEIQDHLDRKLKFQYDSKERLISSAGIDGEKIAYDYDKQDRMTSLVFVDGTKTEISYEPKSGYVTKQAGPGKKITTYTYGREAERRWAVVEDNEGTKNRYEYIDAENKTTFTDRDGKKTVTIVMACCGKPLSIKNEKGVGDEYTYDEKTKLISRTDARRETTAFHYEPRFNQVSEIKNPDGSSLRFVYDGRGNLTYVSSGSEHVKLSYEKHGKIESMTNNREQTITFVYTRFGKPSRIEKTVKQTKGGSIDVTYDRTGEITQVDYSPKTPETAQDIKNTLAGFLRLLKPSGIDFEI